MSHSNRFKFHCLIGSAVAVVLAACPAYAQDDAYQPVFDVVIKPGNNRTLGYGEAMMPVYQNPDQIVYTDIRLMLDSQQEQEGNLGVGYRQVVNGDAIAGAYAYADRRSSKNDKYYTQATIGAEYLKDQYEMRVNGYIPLTEEKQIAGVTKTGFSGTTLTVDSGSSVEENLGGFDVEGGFKIPNLKWDTRAFAGYYHFKGDETDTTIDGGRARFYTEPTKWLRIGGEVSHDNERDTNAYAEVRVRIPLGGFDAEKKHTGIRARMMEPVVRDVDIVTKTKDNSVAQAVGVSGFAGQNIDVIVVDNTAAGGGDGSFARPFNTLAAAQAAAGAGDTIYVRTGSGTTGQANGVVLSQSGQRLIGEGVALTLDTSLMNLDSQTAAKISGTVIRSAGTAPTITNGAGVGVNITGDNVTVSGLTVTGATGDGIAAVNANNFNITRNTVTNAGDDGIQVTVSSGTKNGSVTHNTINGGGTDNIEVAVSGGTLGSAGNRFIVSDNTFLNATNTSFFNPVSGTGVLYSQITRNSASGATFNGFHIGANNTSTLNTVFNSNVATGADNDGLLFEANNTSTVLVSMSSNTSTGNGAVVGGSDTGLKTVQAAGASLTFDMGGGSLGSTGGNRIFSNSGTELDIDLNGGTLFAQGNWWGVNTGLAGGEKAVAGGETIDASGHLTTDPGLPF